MKEIFNFRFILTVVALFLLACAYSSFKLFLKERGERKRIENSFAASQQQLQYYRAKNGDLVAKNDAMILQISEVKKIFPRIIDEIRNLKINPHKVESYSETVIQQNKDIITRLRDSTIYDTVPVRVFNYHDEFYTVKGISVGDTQKVHIESRDSLIQVVYKGERCHPWLWVFSRRKLEQVVGCKNPNSQVKYSKYLLFRN